MIRFLVQVVCHLQDCSVAKLASLGQSEAVIKDLGPVGSVDGLGVLLQDLDDLVPVVLVVIDPGYK